MLVILLIDYYLVTIDISLQMFERENRREKILEAKSREIKLKVKTNQGQDQGDLTMLNGRINVAPFKDACEQAAAEYFVAVEQERLRRIPGNKRR